MNSLVIAEVAQSHDGSFGTAKSFIDLSKDVGANAIKFQMHFASYESSKLEKWRVKFSEQDDSRYDYWRRMEFSETQWKILRKYAKEKNLKFIVSTFSEYSVDLAQKIEVDYFKIASGELTNVPMLKKIAKTNIPVILSSGMSSIEEIKNCINHFRKSNIRAVLHCTSMYPTPLEEVGLEYLQNLKDELKLPVGISDHSGNPNVSTIAAYLGAEVFELHLKFHDLNFGPDISSSLDPKNFKLAVAGIYDGFTLKVKKLNKQVQLKKLSSVKKIFGRSLFLLEQLNKGEVLKKSNICYKKPGGGMPWHELNKIVGKKALKNIDNQTQLKKEFFYD